MGKQNDDDGILILEDDVNTSVEASSQKTVDSQADDLLGLKADVATTDTAEKKDEDLIIFDEEIASDSLDVKEETLTFDTEEKNDTTSLNLDDLNSEIKEKSNSELELTLDTTEEAPSFDMSETLVPEEESKDTWLDLLGSSEDNTEEEEEEVSHAVGTVSEILWETLSELSERKEVIQEDLDSRNAHISDLEAELKDEKSEVTSLKKEKTSLEKNQKLIEDMKIESDKTKTTRKVTKK